MKKTRASENVILSRLTQAGKEHEVGITYTHNFFFLRLLDYAEQQGKETEDGLSVTVSVQELARILDVPLRTTIQSLSRLTACGALQRKKAGKGAVPRTPIETTLVKRFYQKEEDND